MRRVVVESPFAGNVDRNLAYGRTAMRDCLLRDEAPFASHLLYTQPGILEDTKPDERRLGMKAGQAWYQWATACVVYQDLGISQGMKEGIERASMLGLEIEYRNLPDWAE